LTVYGVNFFSDCKNIKKIPLLQRFDLVLMLFYIKMQVFNTQEALKAYLKTIVNQRIGFVPTMGALHDGHLSLVARSNAENDVTVSSIFVNPTQFNNASDLANYPIQTEQDIIKLEKADCDILYLPKSKEDVYQLEQPFTVDLGQLATVMEGAFRPGHFEGVMRVVKLLFEIVAPHNAYFGLKDYQQYLVIKSMVEQLHLPVVVVGCSIIREVSGLAMSSRNLLLSKEELHTASEIIEVLKMAKNALAEHTLEDITAKCLTRLCMFSKPEYFEIREASTLSIPTNKNQPLRAFVVAKIGSVRLIDNLALNYED
jgi:pantoate--beta-alanine ligase